MSEKKRVRYQGEWYPPQVGRSATLSYVQGHYRLGDSEFVQTSPVLRIEWDEAGKATEIETLNTIYVKGLEKE